MSALRYKGESHKSFKKTRKPPPLRRHYHSSSERIGAVHTRAQRPLQTVLTHLRRVVDEHGTRGATDAELLERYVAGRDESAFELLVWRHGTMVLQTCRRLLHQSEDAEDAFQATFLALVRQASSIGFGER